MTLEKVEAPRKMQSQQHACWASSINFNLQTVYIFPHILILYKIASLLAKNLQRKFSNINPRFRDLGRLVWVRQHYRLNICSYWLSWQLLSIRGQDPNNSSDSALSNLGSRLLWFKWQADDSQLLGPHRFRVEIQKCIRLGCYCSRKLSPMEVRFSKWF